MTTKGTKRVERKSLYQRGPQTIAGDRDPNYQYRFVNDTGSRIDNFIAAGYEIVTDDELTVGDSRVNDPSNIGSAKRVTSNDGTVAYLMRQKQEYYKEDQAAKEDALREQEKAMTQTASQGTYGKLTIK